MANALWTPPFCELMSTAKSFYDKAVELYVEYAVREAESKYPRAAYETPGGGHKLSPSQEAELRKKAKTQAQKSFADVLELFQAFADCPDPAGFAGSVESLKLARAALAYQAMSRDPLSDSVIQPPDAFGRITTTGGFVDDWSGDAARQFKANYLDKLPAQIGTQFQVATALLGAVQAEQEIWRNARADICVVAAKGLAALDDLGGCSQAEWTLAFTVVASVAAVAGAVLAAPESGGATLVVAIAIVGALSQVTGAVPIEGSPKEAEYHGDTPQAVVEAVRQGIHDLIQRIVEQEDCIARVIGNDVTLVDEHWRELRPEPPDLGSATEDNVRTDRYFGGTY